MTFGFNVKAPATDEEAFFTAEPIFAVVDSDSSGDLDILPSSSICRTSSWYLGSLKGAVVVDLLNAGPEPDCSWLLPDFEEQPR